MRITAIVVNWNRAEDTLACVRSLAASTLPPGVTLKVLVVENGSSDDGPSRLRPDSPAVRDALTAHGRDPSFYDVLSLPRNLGFAGGCNAGLRQALDAGADWTLLINNDAWLAPDCLAEMLAAAGDPTVGLVTATIYHADRPDLVWPQAGRRRRLTLAGFDTTAAAAAADRAPYDIDWATGCGLLVRASVWRRIGLLDERYFMYYEDHDLCLRAQAAGWRLRHAPRARMWHRVSASSGGGGSRAHLRHLGRSSVRFYLTHTKGWHRVLIVGYRLGSLVRLWLGAVARGRVAEAAAYTRGVWEGLADAVTQPSGGVSKAERVD